MLLSEAVAVHEGALVGVEDPFAHVIAVEVEPGSVVSRIPLLLSLVGVAEIGRGRLGDELRGYVCRFVFFVHAGIAGVPVVSIGGDTERKLLCRYKLEGICEILVGPIPTADRPRRSPVG